MSLPRMSALASALALSTVLGGCTPGGNRAPEDLDLSLYSAALIGSEAVSAEGDSEFSLLMVRPDGSFDRFELGRSGAELERQGDSLVLLTGRTVTRYGPDPVTERLGSFGDTGDGSLLGREDSTTVVRAGGAGTEVVEIGADGVTAEHSVEGRPVASGACGTMTAVLTEEEAAGDAWRLTMFQQGRSDRLAAPIESGILEGSTGDLPCIGGRLFLTERVHPDDGVEQGIRIRAIDTVSGSVEEQLVDSAGDGFLGFGESRGAIADDTGDALVWLDQNGTFEQVSAAEVDSDPEPVRSQVLDGDFSPDTVHGAWLDGAEAVVVHWAESTEQLAGGSPVPQLEFVDLADPASSTRLTVSEELSDFTFRGENAAVVDAVRLP